MKKSSQIAYLRQRQAEYEELAEQARASGSFGAAVAATKEAHRVAQERSELEEVQRAQRRRRSSRTTEQYYDELLEQVAAVRIASVAAGSMIAANQAIKLESDILTARSAAVDAASTAAREALPLEEIEAEIARLQAGRGLHEPH